MGDDPATIEALRKRARDALVVGVLSLCLVKVPLVFYLVPVFGFGSAVSAQLADRRLTKLGAKPTWAGALAVPLGILVGIIGVVFVAASISDSMHEVSEARDRKAREQAIYGPSVDETPAAPAIEAGRA
ncbi:MAG TPA: hypothetical protein VHE35_27500, partial [Kofleriaceae bacterium]|nr:hypothetical protein [Kofleriaceae bacterium]